MEYSFGDEARYFIDIANCIDPDTTHLEKPSDMPMFKLFLVMVKLD